MSSLLGVSTLGLDMLESVEETEAVTCKMNTFEANQFSIARGCNFKPAQARFIPVETYRQWYTNKIL